MQSKIQRRAARPSGAGGAAHCYIEVTWKAEVGVTLRFRAEFKLGSPVKLCPVGSFDCSMRKGVLRR